MNIPEQTRSLTARIGAYGRDYPKGHRIPPHRHDWHQLIYARTGVMTVSTAEGAWVVPPQRAVWLPAATEHEIRRELEDADQERRENDELRDVVEGEAEEPVEVPRPDPAREARASGRRRPLAQRSARGRGP